MANLFSGLEEFGFDKLSEINVYEDKDKKEEKKNAAPSKSSFAEEDIIFDKTYNCPVCDKEFRAKTVKSGKIKLVSLDTDLRPRYQLADPLKYDAIVCTHCGFAALNRFFKYVTSAQAGLIKSNITSSFKGLKETGEILTYDDAIIRHKFALMNAIVKKAKTSERAYTCLKTAWVIRGKAESLPEDTPNYNQVMESLKKEELEFLSNAYDGFVEAFMKESFPMCGMDENTVNLMVADLARRVGKYEDAGRLLSKVIVARDVNERIKAKAREIKELMKSENK